MVLYLLFLVVAVSMVNVTRFAQQDLTWETSITSNAAIEVGVLNNMLTFTAEYFIKRNNNLLAPLESLPSSGQTITINKGAVPNYNTASVENKGLEFSLEFKKNGTILPLTSKPISLICKIKCWH